MLQAAINTAFVVGLALTSSTAHAMDFTFDPLDGKPNTGVIVAKGVIAPGDDEKLHRMVAELPGSTVLNGIALSSVGGNYLEGVRLATSIRNTGLTTAVIGNCSSACFLIFAAGSTKIVFEGAKIGVHSASLRGVETTDAQATTMQMARKLADLGVPPAIVGKVVTTPADDIAWLTSEDLASMNVQVIRKQEAVYQPGSPLRPGTAASARTTSSSPLPIVPAASDQTPSTGSVPTPETSPAFVAGRKARADYEAWFNELSGDIKSGAAWWAEVRSQAARNHHTCEAGTPLFNVGCKHAQIALGPSDTKRRADPDFKAGWNSL